MSTPTVRTHQLRTGRAGRGATTDLGAFVAALIGDDPPVRIELFDGSALGPPRSEAPATVRVRSRDALRRMVASPGELGLARAYVAGDIDIDGDIYAVLGLRDRLPRVRLTPRLWIDAVRLLRPSDLVPLPPPPEEARPGAVAELRSRLGRGHTRETDAASIHHHYDVSNDFYELVVERHRKKSTIWVSNREPSEWLAMTTDTLLAQSAIDRLTSGAHHLIIEGPSHRQRQHVTLDETRQAQHAH